MAPPNRTEPAPAPAEAAAATAAAAPAASSGGFKAWLPLIITVALMPVLAYGMTSFVLLPHLQKGLGITPAPAARETSSKKSKESAATAKKERVTINKLLVNVAGTMGQRYLLVSLTAEGSGEGFADKIKDADAPLRAMACGALCTKTLADLEKPTARNLITTELISGFNNILGEPMIQQIYLTEFAIQ